MKLKIIDKIQNKVNINKIIQKSETCIKQLNTKKNITINNLKFIGKSIKSFITSRVGVILWLIVSSLLFCFALLIIIIRAIRSMYIDIISIIKKMLGGK